MAITGHEEEFRKLFAQEAAQQLALLRDRALDLEEGGDVDELFRAAHTLKGSAALVGYDPVKRVAHELETLLEEVRSGTRSPDRASADAILAAVDALEDMLAGLRRGEDRAAQGEAAASALAAHIAGEDAPPVAPEPAAETAVPEPGQAAPAADTPGDYLQLPVERVDAFVRLTGEAIAASLGVGSVISERLGEEAESVPAFSDLSRTLAQLQREALRARTVAFERVAGPLRRAVRDVAASSGKDVRWELTGSSTELDRRVLEAIREPLLHLVRNAVDHGVEPPAERARRGKPETGTIRVHAEPRGPEVIVSVSDDGGGIDLEGIRARAGDAENPLDAIFRAGFSTAERISDVSGRGVGLDVVQAAVRSVRGRVEVESSPGEGTTFRIAVPFTLAVLPCFVVQAGGEDYAIPLSAAEAIVEAPPGTETSLEGSPSLRVGDEMVGVSSLASTLGTGEAAGGNVVVVLASGGARHGFRVGGLAGRRDVVMKELGRVLPRIDVVSGAAIQPDGSLMLVLDPAGLVRRGGTLATSEPPHRESGPAARSPLPAEGLPPPARVLVVDDTLTVRELQRSILERAGFAVEVAVDGEAALARLAQNDFDLVLTDVEMPRVDGFRLTREIRANPRTESLPVIMITSRADEADRRRGLEVGANGYIVKSAFDADALLEAVQRVLRRDP